MHPRNYTDEAIVLARRNFGEADRILVVYSKNHGKVSLLAKGVRKPASRKRGHIEIFNHIKFFQSYGRGLDMITEAEIIDNFAQIRKNLKKVSLAYYFMEVIGRTTHENEAHRELFDLVLNNLNALKSEKKLKSLRKKFVFDVLTTLGFWPKAKPMSNPDYVLEEVVERRLNSERVGKVLFD